ncbi:DUF2971 domain-containing protein [Cellulosilyticum sp. I15G10I2]|uniref:DUF2971 domain-containing protein n=1 Tax=Cellulosilyticum sp. I15G10I2 TaxID=1892843 RepID=UPI00085CB29A|nr:DUF2971 domain-containing protein [Cellulosilyticum sp. I15G10I2]
MAKIDSIYHYCTIDTFLAIIQNKTIRLSDLNKTNDYMEKKWANKLIAYALKEQLEEYEIDMDLEEDYWYDEQANNHLRYYKKEIERVLYDESPILISCFSEEKDKLSQWRAYGQDGEGVAIGFNYKLLTQLKDGEYNIFIEKVIYRENDQKKRLAGLIDATIYYVDRLYRKMSAKFFDNFNDFFKDEFDTFCEVLAEDIWRVGCIIKNPAFSEEKEVRIIYNPQLPNREVVGDISLKEAKDYFEQVKEVEKFKIRPLAINYRNNQLVTSCDIDFSALINEKIINEIFLGPKSTLKEDDLYYFLLSKGYEANDIKISRSEATYR